MEVAQEAHEVRGADERHHVVLPSYPNYHVSPPFVPMRRGGSGWLG